MEVGHGGAILARRVVGPDQQVTSGCNGGASRDGGLAGVRESVAKIIAAKVHIIRAWVVEFEPVLEMAIRGVCQGGKVVGHPLVDPHLELRVSRVVSSRGGGDGKDAPPAHCTVREGTVGTAR